MKTIINVNDIAQLSKELHHQSKRIVLVGGCFDLLHLGHITLLDEAKKQGDTLVVLLESDKRIKKLKGSHRPLHTQAQRAQMLLALRSVDSIVLLPENTTNITYDVLVKQLQPAIIATTKDSDSVRYIKKQAKENNIAIYLVKPVPNLSTSRVLHVIMKEV